MKVQYSVGMMMVALSACRPSSETQQPTSNTEAPVAPVTGAASVLTNSAPAASRLTTNEVRQVPRTSLPEPKGPIDHKSIEAAGQVVQNYGALIEEGRLAEAAKLWGDPAAASNFAQQLRPGTHMEIGDLGETEGAAGSIYTSVPVVFYGDTFRKPAQVVLRRVNDVPGSTEAQRRWHIERIESGEAP